MCLCKLVSQCRHIGIYTLTNQIQGNIQVFIFNFIISLIYGFCIIQQDFRITDKREIISLLRIGYHTFSTPFLVAITCTGSWIINFGCFKIRLIPLPRSSAEFIPPIAGTRFQQRITHTIIAIQKFRDLFIILLEAPRFLNRQSIITQIKIGKLTSDPLHICQTFLRYILTD